MQTESTHTGGLCTLAMLLLSLAVPAVGNSTTAPETAVSTDWPQWRGPNRDGVALNSPKVLDSWPTSGPDLLWKSEPIPCNEKGGVGSPIVADGKVFLYVEEPHKTGVFGLTTKQLQEWGWDESSTPELAAKLDAAWGDGKKKDASINSFLDSLDPATVKNIGKDKLKSHLMESWTTHIPWVKMLGYAAYRDKEFPASKFPEEMHAGHVLNACLKAQNTYYDTLICLDETTGNQTLSAFHGNVCDSLAVWAEDWTTLADSIKFRPWLAILDNLEFIE